MEGPTGGSSGYNYNVSACEGLFEAIVNGFIAFDYLLERVRWMLICMMDDWVPTYLLDRNVGEINGYARCFRSIVERELVHISTQAKLEAERL